MLIKVEELDACPECKKDWMKCSCCYCGCCDRWAGQGYPHIYWCKDCEKHILSRERRDYHNLTWFAQFGTDCPNSEKL